MHGRECPDDHLYIEYVIDKTTVAGITKIHHGFRCVYCGVKATVVEATSATTG